METHLVYHVDKGLGVVSTEITDQLELVLARESCPNQRNDIVLGKGVTN